MSAYWNCLIPSNNAGKDAFGRTILRNDPGQTEEGINFPERPPEVEEPPTKNTSYAHRPSAD